MTDVNAEKRVALAKDVLAQLDAKKFSAMHGLYFRKSLGECEVCALGALVMACCGEERLAPTQFLPGMDRCDGQKAVILECLLPVFPREQIILIEAAFEGMTEPPTSEGTDGNIEIDGIERVAMSLGGGEEQYAGDPYDDDYDQDVAEARFERTAEPRLRAIMQNIIDHNGTFVPEAL